MASIQVTTEEKDFFSEKEKEILEHYHISFDSITSTPGTQILFVEKSVIYLSLSSFVNRMAASQQTSIYYDEDYETYVILMIPQSYGEKTQNDLKKFECGMRNLSIGEYPAK